MKEKKSRALSGRKESSRGEPILKNKSNNMAVIGIACRFAGAGNYETFWENISKGIDSISEINRWEYDKNWQPNDIKYVSKWLGLIKDADKFDADFFNISPREAIHMDPQQRILMEETWHCVEDSGVSLKKLRQKRTSVLAPRVEAQRDVILAAYQEAGFTPETVTYSEAQGTGTSLGDPIEIEALTQAFQTYTSKKQYFRIGSVKTNVGHLMGAAGMPGLIKVLLMLRNKQIPPTLNISKINPIIDLEDSPFVIADRLTDWVNANPEDPLRAGISSFGYGGVNNHALIEEYKVKGIHSEKKEDAGFPFLLSAKKPGSLESILSEWRKFVKTDNFSQR